MNVLRGAMSGGGTSINVWKSAEKNEAPQQIGGFCNEKISTVVALSSEKRVKERSVHGEEAEKWGNVES